VLRFIFSALFCQLSLDMLGRQQRLIFLAGKDWKDFWYCLFGIVFQDDSYCRLLITCSSKKVTAIQFDQNADDFGSKVTLTEDLGEITRYVSKKLKGILLFFRTKIINFVQF
jgi:hypothetical protein